MVASQTKQASKAEFNTFVQGLITEASPLNFPVNASVSEANFELNRDGTRDRRRGMDYEENFAKITMVAPTHPISEFPNMGFSSYVWESPGGFVDMRILVVQLGRRIRFFDLAKDSISFDGPMAIQRIDEFPDNVRFSFGTVNGRLVIAAGDEYIIVYNYLGGTGVPAFPSQYRSILVRDLWGIQEEEPFESAPYARHNASPAPERHIYNLSNQGWTPSRQGKITYAGSPPSAVFNPGFIDPIDYFLSTHGVYPKNNDNIYNGLQFQAPILNVINRPSEQLITELFFESDNTTGDVAKGFFIIDLLRRGQSRITAQINQGSGSYGQYTHHVYGVNADYTPGGATCVRGFAGRMFFAGFSGTVIEPDNRSPSLESFVLFSQLVKNDFDIVKCYQEGDPTSREGSDVIDTDGGFIRISGCAKIVGMKALGASLIVFGTNGVWEINGGSDYGFNATNFKVTKLSSVGAFSESSIVEEVGKLYFWSLDGIYMVGADQFQVNNVQNLTQRTIQTLYDAIPSEAKDKAVGVYDSFSKKVRWVYNEGVEFTNSSASRELVLDTVLGAFYINTIGNASNLVEIVSAFVTPPFRSGDIVEEVVVGTDEVFADTDLVVLDALERVSGLQSIKYFTIINEGGLIQYTFSDYNNTEFTDWEKANGVGVDAKAFLLTGSQIAGDSSVAKQIPYLTMHFRRTENGYDENDEVDNQSSCLARSQWDFANTINSHKWSSLFQAYRYTNSFLITDPTYDNGFELVTTKNKLRGRGKAFSLYLESEPKKDLRIVGWNLAVNGNAIT